MNIGILGDTHDHITNLKKAVTILNRESDGLSLHTGDFVSPFVIPIVSSFKGEILGVYGNNDGDRDLLQERCRESGNVRISGNYFDGKIDGARIALLHGHEKNLLATLLESGLFDLVVYGHSHKALIERIGNTLVINPGEVCGYISGTPTCAIYNTDLREGYLLTLI